jgi:molecular chaperone GrpE
MADEDKLEPNPDTNPDLAPANENGSAVAEKPSLEPLVIELRDKYLRAVAEAENIRKRAERDIADMRVYGIAAFARDVLAVADNLARATESLDPDARTAADGTFKALLDGVELTRRELQKTLEKNGVRRLEPLGEKFDPNFHQAMFEIPTPDVPAGTVAQVMQPGYAIGERVLRPALVAVAKGGVKPPPKDRVDVEEEPTGK